MTKITYGSCTGQRDHSIDHVITLTVICQNKIGSKHIGGLGGNFGEIVLIGFEQQPKICTVQHAGK